MSNSTSPRFDASSDLRRQQANYWLSLADPPRYPPFRRTAETVGTFLAAGLAWLILDSWRSTSDARLGSKLRWACERLGPTFIKYAQVLSFGEGILPVGVLDELKRCRDDVNPVPFEEISSIIEDELGGTLEDRFTLVDRLPLAAGSIAQVHSAVLKSGVEAVIKVRRPGIEALIATDIAVMAWLADLAVGRFQSAALANPKAIVELFAETVAEELDFRIEAANMADLRQSLDRLGRSDQFELPTAIDGHVTASTLVMERVGGMHLEDQTSLIAAGVVPSVVLETLMLAFLEGVYLHGLFHGDLHGGNVKVLPDGRVGLVDFGIVGRLEKDDRLAYLRLMVATITNDPHSQVAAMRDLGSLPADIDVVDFAERLGLTGQGDDPLEASSTQLAEQMNELIAALLSHGARLPKSMVLYLKNLLYIEGAIATLDSDLDLVEIVDRVAMNFTMKHGKTIAGDLGLGEGGWSLDLSSVKSWLGAEPDGSSGQTYAQFKERQLQVNRRLGRGMVRQRLSRMRRRP